MIVLIAALAGAIIGGLNAARLKGNKLDVVQYATIYAIAFALWEPIAYGLFLGVATATEAAAVGAVLTALIGMARGRLGVASLLECLVGALRTSVAPET